MRGQAVPSLIHFNYHFRLHTEALIAYYMHVLLTFAITPVLCLSQLGHTGVHVNFIVPNVFSRVLLKVTPCLWNIGIVTHRSLWRSWCSLYTPPVLSIMIHDNTSNYMYV